MTEKLQQPFSILEVVRMEYFLPCYYGYEGPPQKARSVITRSFVVKMVYNLDRTTFLIDRLKSDKSPRSSCGWGSLSQLPSGAIFSRALAEFAQTGLSQRLHEALILRVLKNEVVLHNAHRLKRRRSTRASS